MFQKRHGFIWLLCCAFLFSICGDVSAQKRNDTRIAGAGDTTGTVQSTEQHATYQLSAETLKAYSAQNIAYSTAVQNELQKYITLLRTSGAPSSQIDQLIAMAAAFKSMAPAYEELWAAIANTGSPLYFSDDGRVFVGSVQDLTNYDTPTVYLASGSSLLCTWSQCFWNFDVGGTFTNAMAGQVIPRINPSLTNQVFEVNYSDIGQTTQAAQTETGITKYQVTLNQTSTTTTTTKESVVQNNWGQQIDQQTKNQTIDGLFNWTRTLNYDLLGTTYQKTTVDTKKGYNYYYFDEGCKAHCCSPLVLDVTGSGKIEASQGQWRPHPGKFDKTRVAEFDFWGNGFPVLMEWVGPHDGLLCVPKADGTVDGTCFFGVVEGYLDGFGKLTLLDKNHDGVISGDELKGLCVWQDKNQNGRIDDGELQAVTALGITRINLAHNKSGVGSFVMNGRSRYMFDWWPTMAEVKKVTRTALVTPPSSAKPGQNH